MIKFGMIAVALTIATTLIWLALMPQPSVPQGRASAGIDIQELTRHTQATTNSAYDAF